MILPNGQKVKFDDKLLFRWFHSKELEVGIVVSVGDDYASVVFARGFSSESETLKLSDIYGIVDESRSVPRIKVPGFSGHFILFKEINE